MKRELCYYGNPLLREKCLEIKEITPEIRQLAEDMIETMDALNGVGLAASQVGVLLRLFVIRPEIKTETGDFALGAAEVYINPVISSPTEQTEIMNEGCLSFPGLHVEIERPYGVHLEALNLQGEKVSLDAYSFKAREIMHENDHLNGKFFVDRAAPHLKKEIEPDLKIIKKRYSIYQ